MRATLEAAFAAFGAFVFTLYALGFAWMIYDAIRERRAAKRLRRQLTQPPAHVILLRRNDDGWR